MTYIETGMRCNNAVIIKGTGKVEVIQGVLDGILGVKMFCADAAMVGDAL